jgi:hypothetical protein
MKLPMLRNLSAVIGVLLVTGATAHEANTNAYSLPDEGTLERIVGNRIVSLKGVEWAAPAIETRPLAIYSVRPPAFHESTLRRLANHFGVDGEVERIPGDTQGQIGYWIRAREPNRYGKHPNVYLWLTTGRFGFDGGDDGYRYDKTSRKPAAAGVPSKEEARDRALELLPVFGFTTNDLERRADGSVRWSSSASEIHYTDRVDNRRKTQTIAVEVSFFQHVALGATTDAVGDGAQIRFKLVSDARVASAECFFRSLDQVGSLRGKTRDQVLDDLRVGRGWAWRTPVGTSFKITNCVVSYPQGNSWLHQPFVWPFYKLIGISSVGSSASVYVPAWQ